MIRTMLAAGSALAVLATAGSALAQQPQPAPKAAPAVPDTSSWSGAQFRAAALNDVEAAYRLYLDNHPGVFDRNNPGFGAQLRRARDAGLAAAARATNRQGYADALGAFSVGMADHHATLGVRGGGGAVQTMQWPGFIPVWRDGKLFVHTAEQGVAVNRGEQILACDGLEPDALARRFLAASSSYPLTPGEYWLVGGAPFNATLEALARRAGTCSIRAADGAVRSMTLDWKPAPADLLARRAVARAGRKSEIVLSEPRPGIFWAGMPTFAPSEVEIAQYRKLFADLASKRESILSGRALVIDLRYNGGGSSSWSMQAARQLWGDAAVDAVDEPSASSEVWWRASHGNTAYVSTWEALFIKQGQPSDDVEWARETAAGMRAALDSGKPFYVEKSDPIAKSAKPSKAAMARSFTAPVYVITHGGCGSACLDALDLFKAFPNVRLIGSPTASDTNYMDVRAEILPSGVGLVVIPQKVYLGRKRASGAFYTPDIVMAALDWSPESFLDRIEADLTSQARVGR